MEKLIKIIILLFFLSAYIISFNFMASLDYDSFAVSKTNGAGSTMDQANFGDAVAISSHHNGFFYNKETQSFQDYKNSKLIILGFIPLPLIIRNINFFYVHLILGVGFSLITLIVLFYERRYYE